MKRRWIGIVLAAILLLSMTAFADADIEIIQQPTDISVPVGETGTATVVAQSDGDILYRWYYRTVGSTEWKLSGMTGYATDTIRVPVTQKRLGQQYKCVLTDENGERIETDVIEIVDMDKSEITIESQPENLVAAMGQSATATVHASSDAELSYQWYFKKANETCWKASGMTGSKTDTITVKVTSTRLGQEYKCVITTEDGARVETDVVRVELAAPGEIIISKQPEDIRAAIGEKGTASVEVSSDADVSYRWYFKKANEDEWKASGMTGSKTNTITIPVTEARIGQQYRCIITSSDGMTVESDVVTVLGPAPSVLTIEKQPSDIYAVIDEVGTATVVATDGSAVPLVYQWYYKAAGSAVWKPSGMSGSKTATIKVPVTSARIGQQYKCLITSSDGRSIESDIVTICEKPDITLTITRNPDSYIVPVGQPVQLDVSVRINQTGYRMTYQWYQNGEMLEGANKRELIFLSVNPENAGTYYCVVSGCGYTAVSESATVEVLTSN